MGRSGSSTTDAHQRVRHEPRTVIAGGMFDPPHNGHVAMLAAASIPGDDIRIIVAGVPPHRAQPVASAQDRLDMAAAGLAHEPVLGDRMVTVSDVEIRRGRDVAYTVDTVRSLTNDMLPGRPVLVIGDEHAATITTWHAWEDLLSIVDLAVVTRTGIVDATSDGASNLESLLHQRGGQVWWCPMQPVTTSSTAVRELVASGDLRSAAELVPAGVLPLLPGVYGAVHEAASAVPAPNIGPAGVQ